MTSQTARPSLDEVLDEFFFSADKPSASMVLRACEAHPKYREDILEFAALWSSYEASPEFDSAELVEVSDASVSRLQSFVLNCLHEVDAKPSSAANSDAEAARKAIQTLSGNRLKNAAVAAGLGSSTLLLTKILTKSIVDVPHRVVNDLAHYLKTASAALQQCFEPNLAGAKSYSATIRPSTSAQESWEQAVRSLSVSSDERQRLLALQDRENV